MPIFDYKCPDCERKIVDVYVKKYDDKVKCTRFECKKMCKLVPNRVAVHTFPSGGVYLEHVSPKGETFHTKQEMKDYAKKHDLQLGYLE